VEKKPRCKSGKQIAQLSFDQFVDRLRLLLACFAGNAGAAGHADDKEPQEKA